MIVRVEDRAPLAVGGGDRSHALKHVQRVRIVLFRGPPARCRSGAPGRGEPAAGKCRIILLHKPIPDILMDWHK